MTVSSTLAADFDLREGLKYVPNSIAAVGALHEGEPTAFVVGTFAEVSLDPPLVSIAVQKQSRTWEKLRSAESIGISILSAHHNAVVYQLGSRSGDRFQGVGYTADGNGAILLDNSAVAFRTTVEEEIVAGDHVLVLLRVIDYVIEEISPLVYVNAGLHVVPGSDADR